MGSYALCWLGEFYVGSSKNNVAPDLMSLFRRLDKRIVSNPATQVPRHIQHWLDERGADGFPVVYYSAPIRVIRDRLNLMGYTLRTSRRTFEDYADGARRQQRRMSDQLESSSNEVRGILSDHNSRRESILSELTPDSWLAGLSEIKRLGLRPEYYGRYDGPHADTLLGHMLSHEWYGFPGYDINVALRLVLEICPEAEVLVYDVTDLINSEYFDADDDLVEYALSLSANEYHSKAKIILLTEGKTDAWILEEALELLYPHLADYYSFMKFDLARLGGGAGNLVNLVKSFASAGIVNKIVAIFDNDTAGTSAIKLLEKISMPAHISVLQLPQLDSLKSYATEGPTGSVDMDVNGVAGSIELYLGRDVLLGDNGCRAPVQWTGFDSGLRQYQGEVIDKDRLHDRFRQKLEIAKLDRSNVDGEQWDDLKKILEVIFAAFHDYEGERICEWARASDGV